MNVGVQRNGHGGSIVVNPEKLPTRFKNQGYWKDLNKEGFWSTARLYNYEHTKGLNDGEYIHHIKEGNDSTFLFNIEGINEYFKECPPEHDVKDVPIMNKKGEF